MSAVRRAILPLLLAVSLPSLAGAQRRPDPRTDPRLRPDTVDRRPEPAGVPCTVDCTPTSRELWYPFDTRIEAGLGAGATRIATGSAGMVGVPLVGADAAWTRTFHGIDVGSSGHGWVAPAVDGASGWGGSVMLRAAVPLSDAGTELHFGGGVGVDRITVGRAPTISRQEHVGVAYEAGLSQEFVRGPSVGLVLSAGITGLQGDGGYPTIPGPMFVAGLGLRWHSWSGTSHDTQGRYPRRGPRWPRPIP